MDITSSTALMGAVMAAIPSVIGWLAVQNFKTMKDKLDKVDGKVDRLEKEMMNGVADLHAKVAVHEVRLASLEKK